MKLNLVIGLAVASLGLSGCSGSSTDPTKLDGDATTTSLKMQLVSATSGTAKSVTRALVNDDGSFAPDGSGVVISAARINIEKIELKLPDGIACADVGFVEQENVSCEEELEEGDGELESEVKVQGPFVFDLITGASTPSLDALTLPSGIYRKIKIQLEEAKEEDGVVSAGDALLNNTLVTSGSITDADGVDHAFNLAFKFSEEIEIENESGIEVPEGNTSSVVAGLNVEQWFAGTDIGQCISSGNLTLEDDDSLELNEESEGQNECNEIKDTIKENIKNSFNVESEDDDSSDDESDDSGNDSADDLGDDNSGS